MTVTDSTSRPSLAAKRMRRYRQRRRAGLRCLNISETEIDALIRIGLLKKEMRNDLGAVIDALHAYQTLDSIP
jgi:hypothetical protein